MIPVAYNLRSLSARRSSSIATAIGIALVVFVFGAALMLGEGVKATLAASGSRDNAIILRKGAQAEIQSVIEDTTAAIVLAAPEVAQREGEPVGAAEAVVLVTMPKGEGGAEGGEAGGGAGYTNMTVRGIGPGSLRVRDAVRVVEGRPFQPGSDEVLVGRAIAGKLPGVRIGGRVRLKPNREVTVVGVFEAKGGSIESEMWGDIDTIRAAFNRQGTSSSITVRLVEPGAFEALRTRLEADPRLGLEAKRETAYYEAQSQGLSEFIRVLGIVIAFFFSGGATIGAMITMYAQVAQRTKEIGTLRALGFGRGSILVSFLLEAILLSLAGGALGVACSLLLSAVEFSTMNWMSFSEIVFRFTPTPGILVGSLIFAAVMGIAGGLLPAWRAARISPVEAMRS